MRRIFSLALVFALTWLVEFSASAMSKESADLLNQAAIQASEELKVMNKDYNSIIRSRIQSDLALSATETPILPAGPEVTEVENQVASVE